MVKKFLCAFPIHSIRILSMVPYISHRTYLTNHMGSISHHITPLVINSLGGRHTHTQTHTRKHTHANTHTRILSRTEAILKNQAHAGLWPACTWFKNHNYSTGKIVCIYYIYPYKSRVYINTCAQINTAVQHSKVINTCVKYSLLIPGQLSLNFTGK